MQRSPVGAWVCLSLAESISRRQLLILVLRFRREYDPLAYAWGCSSRLFCRALLLASSPRPENQWDILAFAIVDKRVLLLRGIQGWRRQARFQCLDGNLQRFYSQTFDV